MGCGSCGFGNVDGARFCGDCGAPLSLDCSGCGAPVRPGLKFCDQCGTPVGPTPSPSKPPDDPGTLVAQRKTITVVFGDVGGSTGLGERLDPEAAREVMNQYHRDVLELIGEHGGTVDKFNGDGFMATFGIPEVSEDDASRAVGAAVEIQERFAPFAAAVHERHGGDPITLRIGVNTGEIVIAEGDPDIIGDALNVAARLERACPSGGVLVGPETWRMTRSGWRYEPQGEVTVAGRVEPVEVYLVEGTAAEAAETATPFVGRDDEVALLRAQRDQAVENRSLRFVTVIGSPGLGKSRLAREVAAGLDFDHRHTIACERAGSSTFAPVIDLVRAVAGVGTTVAPEAIMAALSERFGDADFAAGEVERLRDAMAGLVGAGPIRSTEESFWAVRRMVEQVGREGPTLLVVDDIQWAEPVVLDLLEHLAEWVTDAAVVLLCLARPEIRDLRPSLTEAGRRADAVVALEGLDAAATAALAERMLGEGELPAALIERIPASTEGNPLFVRELVKMLVDDGVVVRGASGWELTIDAEAVEVPPTIASLLAARIDRLADVERIVLERAAVIGPEFVEGALVDIAGDVAAHHSGGLQAVLERLRRMELVEPTGSYWGDHSVHRFHHVLIRDAAYRRLLKGARADLHEQVAIWLEHASEDLPGDHQELVAFHEEQTLRYRTELGPLDDHTVDVGRRASARLTGAATRSLASDDLAAAGPLAIRALDCLPADDAGRGELLLVACEALLGTGDVVQGEASVDELDARATDDRLRAWAACFRAQLTSMTDPDRLPEAEQEAVGAATVLEALRDDAGAAKGHLTRARILALLGRVGEAEAELDRALTAAREADDARRITAVLGNAPLAALWGPSPVPRAGGRCLDIVRLLRITTRAPTVEATSMRCQALLEALRGRFGAARTMIDRCRRKVDELGLRLGSLEAELFAGQVEILAGDLEAAETALRAASTGLTAMRLGAEAGQATSLLARVLVAKGEVGEADVLVGTAEQMAGRNLKAAVAWRLARAEVLLARDDAAGAVEVARAAVDVVADTDLVVDQTDAELVLARALRAAGDEEGAIAAERRARSLAEAKGATALLGDAPAPDATADRPASVRPSTSATATVGTRPMALREAVSSELEPWRPLDTTVVAMFRELEDASAARDVDRFAGSLSVDLVWHDHRPLFAGRYDVTEALASTTPAERLEHDLILCTTDRVVLVVGRYVTKEFTNVILHAARADAEGRMIHAHTHDLDQVDAAVAAYHDLVVEDAEENDEPLVLNEAVRVADRVNARQALDDLDGAATLLTEDIDHHEHRESAYGRVDLAGRDDVLRTYRSVMAGGGYITGRAIRAAGDRLALMVCERGGPEFPVDFVVVHEADDRGRLCSTGSWDLEDADAALAEFDRRAALLEPLGIEPWDPHATQVWAAVRAQADAANAKDEAAHQAAFSPDLEFVDHRPTFSGRFGADELIASIESIDRSDPRIILCATDTVALLEYRTQTKGYSVDLLNVITSDPEGRLGSCDSFELDQLDEAVDCYHARMGEDVARNRGGVVINEASRTFDRVTAHLTVGDPDDARPFFTDDIVQQDRRPGFGGHRIVGWDNACATLVDIFDGGATLTGRLLRAKGEWLVFRQEHWVGHGFEVDYLSVLDVDHDGRLRFQVLYTLDQYDEAVAEFERRAATLDVDGSAAIEPWDPEATTVMRGFRLWERLTNTGEHHRHTSLYPEELTWTDHRPTFAGTFDSEAVFRSLEPIEQAHLRPILVTVDRVALCHVVMGQADFRAEILQLIQVDRDGVVVTEHTFDPDQIDEAVDVYHRLVAEDAERHGEELITNEAGRVVTRCLAHQGMGMFDRFDEMVAPDFEFDDRRSGFGLRLVGREEFRRNQELTFDGKVSMTGPNIRIVGDRHVLHQARLGTTDYRMDFLWLTETTEDGLAQAGLCFDLDQYDQAVAELERRAGASAGPVVGAPPVEPWDPMHTVAGRQPQALCDAINQRDEAAHRAVLRDDFVWTDRRGILQSTSDREMTVEVQQTVERVSWDLVLCGVERVCIGHMHHLNRGFEIELLVVAALEPGGPMYSVDTYEVEDLDAALDRYHEFLVEDVARHGGEVLINAATRLAARAAAYCNVRGLAGVESLLAPEVELHDHRRGIDRHAIGQDAVAHAWTGCFPGAAKPSVQSRAIRTEGDHLALMVVNVGTEDLRTDHLSLYECDRAGVLVGLTRFDLDALDDAVAHLERRAAELDGASTSATPPERA